MGKGLETRKRQKRSIINKRRRKVVVSLKIAAVFILSESYITVLLGKNIYSACCFTYKHCVLCLGFLNSYSSISFNKLFSSCHLIFYPCYTYLILEMYVCKYNISVIVRKVSKDIFFPYLAIETAFTVAFSVDTENFWKGRGLLYIQGCIKTVGIYWLTCVSKTFGQ